MTTKLLALIFEGIGIALMLTAATWDMPAAAFGVWVAIACLLIAIFFMLTHIAGLYENKNTTGRDRSGSDH
jgi:hypothetical protein